MALEQAKAFLKKLISDDDTKETFSKINPEDVPERAKEYGYDFTSEELATAEKEYRQANCGSPEKLNPDEMDTLAGGALGMDEDAPDGHEMGCLIAYHHYGWTVENDTWCNSAYYCKGLMRGENDAPTDYPH